MRKILFVIGSFWLCLVSLMPVAFAQTETKPPVVAGYGIVVLDGLTAQQVLTINDEEYGDPTTLGPLVLKSGLHIVKVGPDAVPIRIILPVGKTVRLIDQLQPHRKVVKKKSSLDGIAQALMKPSKETGGLVLAGTGVTALVVGLGFGLSAMSVANDANGLNRREVPRADYEAIVRSAQRNAAAANVSLVLGSAAIAGGLYLLYSDGYFAKGAEK